MTYLYEQRGKKPIKKYTKWRTTCFPFYDEIYALVSGMMAIGDGAFHAGTTQIALDDTQLDEILAEDVSNTNMTTYSLCLSVLQRDDKGRGSVSATT